jgi:Zn-dependent metalloprotease
MYKGIKVEGCEYFLHYQNGKLISTNGKLCIDLNISVIPTLSKETCLQYALKKIGAIKYSWEVNKNSTAPQGELILVRRLTNKDFSARNYYLAYKFHISSVEPQFSSYNIFINANSGEVIKMISNIKSSEGTVATLYNGSKSITTNYNWYFKYRLIDEIRNFTTVQYLDSYLADSDNNWNVPDASAHWAAKAAWEYFYTTFERDGVDNNHCEFFVHTHFFDDYDTQCGETFNNMNAYWLYAGVDLVDDYPQANGIYLGSGYSGISNPLYTLDIVGHEYSHGVEQFEANFTYEAESGALSESFADIFGSLIEYAQATGDYTTMDDCFTSLNTCLQNLMQRSMQNPNLYGDPDTYEESGYWVNTSDLTNDLGGVHTNCGVQNHWFYLLVQEIGRIKAAEIAYQNLCYYLGSDSDYLDARNGSIQSAIQLYGSCSAEVEATISAWNSVGVTGTGGLDYNASTPCSLYILQNVVIPLEMSAINNLSSSCAIGSLGTNGSRITFAAGNDINLLPGFSSNMNFKAVIFPCEITSKYVEATNIDYVEYYSDNEIKNEMVNLTSDTYYIFPNPNIGVFTMELSTFDENSKISIFNALGEIVYDCKITEYQSKIDISDQMPGIYYTKVLVNGITFVKKIIVQ